MAHYWKCPRCGAKHGLIEERNGVTVVRPIIVCAQAPGGFVQAAQVQYHFDAWCDCGAQMHFRSRDAIMERITTHDYSETR